MPSDLKLELQSTTPDLDFTLENYVGSAYSPTVDVTEIEGGHEVSITSKGALGIKTDTFDVMDGVDGISPTVEIASTTESHTVTITDRDGEHAYTVSTYAAEETARAAAESQRAAAEQPRAMAESSRASAETDRETSWATISAQATSATQAATSAAQDASQAASDASGAAGHASDVAASAAAAERERVTAETARANAETARATAESARATAESIRATEWATIKAEAGDATSAAETATSDANAAASDATDAAALATRAAANLWNAGNVLRGTLAEGTVLTADDAYAAPPKGVEVYGKSEQVQTTGKNLLSDQAGDWETRTIPNVATRKVYFIPASEGASYTYSRNTSGAAGFFLAWCEDTSFTGYEVIATLTNYQQYTATNTTHAYLVVSISSTADIPTLIQQHECQIEQASANTAYEPYTEGKATPRPDYPQQIKSVDELLLNVHGSNLFDIVSQFERNVNATSAINGNAITITATTTNAFGYAAYNIYDLINDSDYTISFDADKSTVRCIVEYRYVDGVRISYSTISTSPTTIHVPAKTSYIDILLNARTSGTGEIGDATTFSNFQLQYGTTATAYAPYVGQSVEIPFGNNVGRSLPDGTRDTLTLSYIGPSEREGWGVFRATLVQRIGEYDAATLAANTHWNYDSNGFFQVANWNVSPNLLNLTTGRVGNVYCNILKAASWNDWLSEEWQVTQTAYLRLNVDTSVTGTTVDSFKTWLASSGLVFCGELREPITHDLGTIELPVNPAPDLTAWADGGSAQPTLSMVYEQDINVVVNELRDLIADMATS